MTLSRSGNPGIQEFSTESSVKRHQPFRGYECINPVYTQASVALLDRIGLVNQLLTGQVVMAYEWRRKATHPRFLQAALDWLTIQGFLLGGDRIHYQISEKGRKLLNQSSVIRRTVDTYTQIKNTMKWEAGISDLPEYADLEPAEQSFDGLSQFLDAVVPAATSYVHEARLLRGSNIGERAGSVLQREDGIVYFADLCEDDVSSNRTLFMNVLRDAGILDLSHDGAYIATEHGKKLLQIGGYAELTLSYYEMFQKLYPLMKGEETYGLQGTVNRDPELNAHASNGIITIKVAPYLVESLSANHLLCDVLRGGGAYIDYGSGGADMLMQAAGQGPDTLQSLYGIDINSRTNEEACKILDEKGFNGRIELVTGSIVDEKSLREVMEKMKEQGLDSAVASINFILHDIGPELSKKFLMSHAKVFPQVPLMITETLRMPLEVCRAYPNYQQASFQFMHTASGQYLYSEKELRELLDECGYVVEHEKVHSSMPNADKSDRFSTIVTWITRPR